MRQVRAWWDKNADPDLAGYILYWGPRPKTYLFAMDVGNFTHVVVEVGDGNWYFTLTAYDVFGNESPAGPEVRLKRNEAEVQL